MLIIQFLSHKNVMIQFHTANVCENACHTIFIQFQKIFCGSFYGYLNQIKQNVMKKKLKKKMIIIQFPYTKIV